mmetsp:Transcript_28400/g.62429  ORF Transcript_28400/g.62429 Transcript_28400/m.62429 type:complete len:200 (-) Transcript_28400:30-629(-)
MMQLGTWVPAPSSCCGSWAWRRQAARAARGPPGSRCLRSHCPLLPVVCCCRPRRSHLPGLDLAPQLLDLQGWACLAPGTQGSGTWCSAPSAPCGWPPASSTPPAGPAGLPAAQPAALSSGSAAPFCAPHPPAAPPAACAPAPPCAARSCAGGGSAPPPPGRCSSRCRPGSTSCTAPPGPADGRSYRHAPSGHHLQASPG